MASETKEVVKEFRFFRVYKDGRIELFRPPVEKIPPSDDPNTGVRSKDVVISSDPPVSARIFLPRVSDPEQKLPLLFYIHGGGFCMQSAFSLGHHNFVSTVAAEAEAIAVSVEYGLFPARPIPACYEDSWAALRWVVGHADGDGPDAWLNEHADFRRVFIGGNSAGGNISHTLTAWVGSIGLPAGVRVVGVILVQPYFGGTEDDHMWMYMCPTNGGLSDPRLKPTEEDLARLGCEKVLVFVAEKDHLREVAIGYGEELKKSGWRGSVELVEHVGEEHGFQIRDPKNEKAVELKDKFVSFIKDN
ncbi:2-hydroxyisoflavanone dehydratase-like [Syzygium oleosum]|uniref:2-hydroxyisoflavanone dehydratase-like n=1 Tax=Syzygium oleosum TaxID=219896 RepID=UPI0024BAA1CA|nr:2-hydroxyisoflavanone dehydratase-like [Syzygium oleosum]